MKKTGTSLVVQWLGLWAPNAEDLGLIPGQGTGSHMLRLKILHAAAKIKGPTCHTCRPLQPNTYIYIYKPHVVREKEMATHSNVLAWRIPGTGEPGGLPSMRSHRVGHRLKRLSSSSTHGQIPFSLLKGLIREENLRRKHCRGCAANVNSNSLRDGGPGGFLKKLKDFPGGPVVKNPPARVWVRSLS